MAITKNILTFAVIATTICITRSGSTSIKSQDDLDKNEVTSTETRLKRSLDSTAFEMIKRNDRLLLDNIMGSVHKYIPKAVYTNWRTDHGWSSIWDKPKPKQMKGPLDQVGMGLIKKRVVGTLDMGLIKRDYPTLYIDSIRQGFPKRDLDDHTYFDDVKRYIDSLGAGLIKRDSEIDDIVKRYIDSLGAGLIKKRSVAYPKLSRRKRTTDRLGAGEIKPDVNTETEKRYIDSLGAGLIKKDNADTDYVGKRYIDSLGAGLIKRESDKRYIDRLGAGLIKKSHADDVDKRYIDRLGAGLIKRDDLFEDLNKRYIDRVGAGLIKRNDMDGPGHAQNKKRYIDMIGSELVKKPMTSKSESELMSTQDGDQKRYPDGLSLGLIKRQPDSVGDDTLKNQKDDTRDKRPVDHIGSGLIKRN